MFWELTLLNRLYKQNEFCRVKPRMHKDRVIFAINTGDKFATVLFKAQREDKIVTENELFEYFDLEHSETGEIQKHFMSSHEHDKEYYRYTELHFGYHVL